MKDCYRIVRIDEIAGERYKVTPWFLSKKKLFAVYGESVVKDWLKDAGCQKIILLTRHFQT